MCQRVVGCQVQRIRADALVLECHLAPRTTCVANTMPRSQKGRWPAPHKSCFGAWLSTRERVRAEAFVLEGHFASRPLRRQHDAALAEGDGPRTSLKAPCLIGKCPILIGDARV